MVVNKKVLAFIFCCWTISSVAQHRDVFFLETYERAGKIFDSLSHSRKSLRLAPRFFSSFDFGSFTPISGEKIDSTDYFVGYYDSTNKLVKVRHVERVRRISNFELYFFDYPDYLICGLNTFGENVAMAEGYGFIPGFFLHDKATCLTYFVNTAGNDNLLTSPIFPVYDVKQLRTVSIINDSFFLTNVLHFEGNELKYFTEIIFENDRRTVKKERLYYYNSKLPSKILIDEKLTYKSLSSFVSRYRSEFIDALPCLERNRSMPLWIFYGNHPICW